MRGVDSVAVVRIAVLAVALASTWTGATGGGAEPTLDLEIHGKGATVGDHVRVRVVASGGEGLLWGDPQVEAEPGGDWEVVEAGRLVPESSPPAWELVLAPMAVGELSLPPIVVSVRSGDSEAQQIRAAEAPTLTVASVLPPEEEVQPAPLRDPLGVSGFPWEWLPPVAVVLLPLAVVAIWWFRLRRRLRADVDGVAALPPLDELEKAMAELRSRVGRDPVAGLCDGLAGSLRRFLERRTGEAALEMTTVELRQLARRREWPQQTQSEIHRVMTMADAVRFGRQPVAESDLTQAVEHCAEAGRGLDRELLTREEAAAAAASGGGS